MQRAAFAKLTDCSNICCAVVLNEAGPSDQKQIERQWKELLIINIY